TKVSGRLPHERMRAVEMLRGPDHMAMCMAASQIGEPSRVSGWVKHPAPYGARLAGLIRVLFLKFPFAMANAASYELPGTVRCRRRTAGRPQGAWHKWYSNCLCRGSSRSPRTEAGTARRAVLRKEPGA